MITGIVLAAGAGRRFGGPKAFERTEGGQSWVARAVASLAGAGCGPVIVTVPELRDLELDESTQAIVVASSTGQSASLRAALDAVPGEAVAAMITLVDLPDVDASVVRRVIERAGPLSPDLLARATFQGEPGHPVLIGRNHFAPLRTTLTGDRGARDYLAANAVRAVECGDLASGGDVDERDLRSG